jgi:hypothetical protein
MSSELSSFSRRPARIGLPIRLFSTRSRLIARRSNWIPHCAVTTSRTIQRRVTFDRLRRVELGKDPPPTSACVPGNQTSKTSVGCSRGPRMDPGVPRCPLPTNVASGSSVGRSLSLCEYRRYRGAFVLLPNRSRRSCVNLAVVDFQDAARGSTSRGDSTRAGGEEGTCRRSTAVRGGSPGESSASVELGPCSRAGASAGKGLARSFPLLDPDVVVATMGGASSNETGFDNVNAAESERGLGGRKSKPSASPAPLGRVGGDCSGFGGEAGGRPGEGDGD